MVDVREITRSELTLARLVINSSVMPSAKYSWAGSPERFARGRTAMDSIRADGLCDLSRQASQIQTVAASNMSNRASAMNIRRLLGGTTVLWAGIFTADAG